MTIDFRAARLLLFWSLLFWSTRAFAYHEAIHEQLDGLAQDKSLLAQPLDLPTPSQVNVLRDKVWSIGASHSDSTVKSAFLTRYPSREGFDNWAFKEFLGLNPDAKVFGIDGFDDLAAPLTVGSVLAKASRWPDDDRRNRERFAHDKDRHVRHDPTGRPLPADPRQLDMGSLEGTASQAYAHYGLPSLQFSDDPEVLKKEPRRFLYPPTAYAWAREFAQMHTDLALVASALDLPTLTWIYAGNAHHYLEDVGNQIHTLQAIYPFFFDAKLQSYYEELRSLGGVLRPRDDFVAIGIRIITNHHLLCEELFMRHVLHAMHGGDEVPAIKDAVAGVARGDADLDQALATLPPNFATAIASEVIERSSQEGGQVYELIRSLADPALSTASGVFETDDDPNAALKQPIDQSTLTAFYTLQARGFARAGSAIRAHLRGLLAAEQKHDAKEAGERLVRAQLLWLDARDKALDIYTPKPKHGKPIDPWPAAGFIFVVALTVILYRRRRRAERERH